MFPRLNRWRAHRAVTRARKRLQKRRYESALYACDFAIEMDGDNADAVALVHEVQQAQIAEVKAALKDAPDNAEAYLQLARLYAAEEDARTADRHLREGLRLMPSPTDDMAATELLRLRGRISCGLGLYERALDELRRGDEPGFVQAEIQYYGGLSHLGLGRRMTAFGVFEALIDKNPWIVHHRLQELKARAS